MANYQKLLGREDVYAARDAFHALFVNGESCDEPVRNSGSGIILWGIHNELTEEQYRVLTAAARSQGEVEAYLSFLGAYKGDGDKSKDLHPDFENTDHFRIDLGSYPPRALGEEWWQIVEHAIYSVRGRWGLVTSLEWHAIAVGTPDFRAQLVASSVFKNSLQGFLEHWRDSRDRLGGQTSWVPALLANVYGSEEADRLLKEFGEPRHTWSRDR